MRQKLLKILPFWLFCVSGVRQMVSNVLRTSHNAREANLDQIVGTQIRVEYFSVPGPMNFQERVRC